MDVRRYLERRDIVVTSELIKRGTSEEPKNIYKITLRNKKMSRTLSFEYEDSVEHFYSGKWVDVDKAVKWLAKRVLNAYRSEKDSRWIAKRLEREPWITIFEEKRLKEEWERIGLNEKDAKKIMGVR